jgi:hypothetical protein
MNRLFIIACVIFLVGILSCEKKDETTSPDQFPEWLQAKITELTSKQDICSITDVTVIEYNGKIYYHIYCGLWSCMYCHLFDEWGNRPEWETDEFNNFLNFQKVLKTLPACPD